MTTELEEELEFDETLEPEILTEKDDSKTLPCRKCKRACVVNRFASPLKTECSVCRKASNGSAPSGSKNVGTLEIDVTKTVERLTDKVPNKTVACRKCRRGCVVTVFATPSKVECNTCRGVAKHEHREKILIAKADSVDPAKLENLTDGLINPPFKTMPLCPFDPEHEMHLMSICHSPNYGPRHLKGYNAKGIPQYDQQTGESAVYQCKECRCVVSYSTQHQLPLLPQNAPAEIRQASFGVLESILGVDKEAIQDVA